MPAECFCCQQRWALKDMESDLNGNKVVGKTHPVRNMDKNTPVNNTIFSKLHTNKFEHLKPLSVYSRMITFDEKSSLHHVKHFPDPFINFKIEVVNNCVKKRKLDDSSPEYNCETPAKKSLSANALSPDSGCFMDYCSPPSAISLPALLDKTHSVRNETKESANPHFNSEYVDCESITEPGGDEGTVPDSLKCENVLLNFGPTFDFDVDDIMCLSPFGTCSAKGFSDHSESGKNPGSNTLQNKALLIPTVTHGQELERGDLVEGQEELKKDINQNVKDEGYFSLSLLKDCKIVNPQLHQTTSSPMFRTAEVGEAENKCHPEKSSELGCPTQAVLHGPHVSFTGSDLCPAVSGLPLESAKSAVEPLEEDVEEMWDIGLPIFESSMCRSVTVKLNADSEQSKRVSEEVQGDVMEPPHKCQTTLSVEEVTLDTSYETTLPLQVQVKSVVVAPSQLPSSSKPVGSLQPDQNTKPAKPSLNQKQVSQTAKCSARSLRPVIFKREADWEHEKSLYVCSVTRHMNERSGTNHYVMTELLQLMTDVAHQTPGTRGNQWQHPSDLTRRNYQRRFGNMVPKIALREWQAKNCTTHKRFSKVPKLFERSPFP
ncbi:hypothetical protein PAMP_006211 [Pampus punctatissimus]